MAAITFAKHIIISDISALKKIDDMLSHSSVHYYRAPIRKADVINPHGKKYVADKLTAKF